MGVYDKIEEIRKKPEHIRLRYVWFMVGISTVAIILLWWFSFKSKQIEVNSAIESLHSSDTIPQINEQTEALKNTVKEARSAIDAQLQAQSTQQNTQDTSTANIAQ